MSGIAMLLKSMGVDPEAMQTQIGLVVTAAGNADKRIEKLQADVEAMGRTLDMIAARLGVSDIAAMPGTATVHSMWADEPARQAIVNG